MRVATALRAALQVKTLRLLQYFPAPADASVLGNLNDLLRKIIRGDPATGHTSVSVHCPPAACAGTEACVGSQLSAQGQACKL
jgi:hypothetical protein